MSSQLEHCAAPYNPTIPPLNFDLSTLASPTTHATDREVLPKMLLRVRGPDGMVRVTIEPTNNFDDLGRQVCLGPILPFGALAMAAALLT